MAGLSLGGLNLDINGIVSQLMSIEARPLNKLVEQKTDFKAQLSELGRLKSALSTFQSSMEGLSSLDKFEKYKASNSEASDKQSFTTSVDKEAIAGIYSINVTSLASVNKLGQDPNAPIPVSFDSTTPPYTDVADDKLVIGDGSNNISISIKDKSISEIRDAINTAASDTETGLSASVIQTGDDAFQLVITATKTGTDNKLVIDNSAGAGASTALGLTEIQQATNGVVEIDGYEVISSTDEIKGAIEGVTLNLTQINPSASSAELSISRDTAASKSAVNSFIKSYNSLVSSIEIYESGALKGDSFLRSIKNSLKNELNSSSGTGIYNYLAEIGVTSNKDSGDLELNSDVFNKAIANDYEAVSKLFAEKDKGIAYRLDNLVDEFISFDGLIKSKQNTLDRRIRLNDKDQERVLSSLELKEASLIQQFSTLDTLISKMNSTSASLAGQLAALPGYTR